jgi:hypothetical protein
VEREFEERLQRLTPSAELFALAGAIFKDLWDKQAKTAAEGRRELEREVREMDAKIRTLLDRLIESDTPLVVQAYERRIAKLEKDKLAKLERASSCAQPKRDYDEMIRTALDFLASPWSLWKSERLEDKRAVLELTFPGNIEYDRERGFRTA